MEKPINAIPAKVANKGERDSQREAERIARSLSRCCREQHRLSLAPQASEPDMNTIDMEDLALSRHTYRE